MDQPLVSIILPVYNAQNHLARCIGSILNQTYKNIELIILNDGSKDHSLPVCEEFRPRTAASCWWTRRTPVCPTPATWA